MSFTIRPLTPRDLNAYNRINAAAFEVGLSPYLWPNGRTDADRQFAMQGVLQDLREKPTIKYMVVVDTSTTPPAEDLTGLSNADRMTAEEEGRVAGISIWRFQDQPQTEEELDAEEVKANDPSAVPPTGNREMWVALLAALAKAQRDIGGIPYARLKVLAVNPAYQRR